MLRNKLEDAQQLYRDVWETTCRTRGQDHLESIRAGYWLNRLLRQMGQYDAAEAIGRHNVAAAHQSLSPEHTLRGEAVTQLALTLRAEFQNDEADSAEEGDFAAIFKKKESVTDDQLIALMSLDDHNLAMADEWGRRALDTMRQAPSQHAPISLAETLALLGRILVAKEETKEAAALLRECLAIRRHALSPDHWLVAETESLLGDCLARQGLYAEAEPLLLESLAAIAASGPSQPLRTVQALERIVDLYDRWGKPAEAQRWRQELQVKLRDSEKT